MHTCGPRRSIRRRDSRMVVVGFWSARLRYPTRRVPLKRAGSSLAGPRVNDHRKPMCVTSQGPKPCSVSSLTRTTQVSRCVCASLAASLSLRVLAVFLLGRHREKERRSKRERQERRETTLLIHHYRGGSASDHFSCFTSVMKRFLPSSFTLPIYRFNYRLVARCERARDSRWLEKWTRAGSWNDVKSD